MGILDSIVEWVATQIMNLLDMITGSVLGALGCDMSTFLRYFPAAETLYEVFVAIMADENKQAQNNSAESTVWPSD